MNVTPMVAAISLESREAVEMLLFEDLPREAKVQIDQNQHVHAYTVWEDICFVLALCLLSS